MNIVKAIFSGGCTQIAAAGTLWQWDQGQILQIVGLDLPDAYQVEFSNQPSRGSAAPMIGGVDGVEIPDVYLTTGKPVYAFIVLHTGEDDRETEYRITIYVNARPQPTDVPPTPEQQAVIDQLIAALNAGVQKAEDAAEQAEAAIGYMPKIVDGTWWVYDAEAETWTDTGIQAEGQDGVGISEAVLNADYTLTLTFTDGSSYTTPSIRGAQGKPGPIGPTPDISIGTVTTGAAGSQASATMTGTPERPVLNLTIPRGDPGEVTQAELDALAEDVAANTQGLADQKSAIEDLEALVDRKAGMLVDTASGAIASFVPDSTIDNLLGVSVAVEPVQDLHGYDSPWPAGGGKNIWNPSQVNAGAPNNPYTLDGDTYTMTWTNGAISFKTPRSKPFPAGQYTLSVVAINSDAERVRPYIYKASDDTTIASGAPPQTFQASAPFYVGVGGVYNNPGTAIFKIQLELGSSATSYSPYSNICPISGWDSVEVETAGMNLFDKTKPLAPGFINASGEVEENSSYQHSDYFTKVNPSTAYIFSGKIVSTGIYNSIAFYDANKNFIGRFVPPSGGVGSSFTTPANCAYIKFNTSNAANTNLDTIQIEAGTTAAEYKPYAGNRYTIQLGQTVYGGTLTIAEDGSVNALVDRAKRHFSGGNDAWVVGVGAGVNCNRAAFQFSGALLGSNNGIVSDVFKSEIQSTPKLYHGMVNNNGALLLGVPTTVADRAAMNSWAAENPFDIVYYIAPIEIQLDPVTISTISGQTNNVWADAGDVTVEFAADLKHYIDSKIAAAVAALS